MNLAIVIVCLMRKKFYYIFFIFFVEFGKYSRLIVFFVDMCLLVYRLLTSCYKGTPLTQVFV